MTFYILKISRVLKRKPFFRLNPYLAIIIKRILKKNLQGQQLFIYPLQK